MATMTEGRSDWTWLPDLALASVLSYLINSEDYIRFSIVCKSWHSVAKDQKHRHMTIVHKQVPFLLLTTNQFRWSLYSVTQKRLYDFTLKVPFDRNMYCCGLSHGWLAFAYRMMDSRLGSRNIILFNPFTQNQIPLPPITFDPSFGMPYIEKVVLSADPSLQPNDYTVAVRRCQSLALIRPGRDVNWRIHSTREFDGSRGKRNPQGDITFDKNGKWVYTTTTTGSNTGIVVRVNIDDTAVLEVLPVHPSNTNMHFGSSLNYLVETTNRDLLMILWCKFREAIVRVFKLEADGNFVEVEDLNGDAVFIADNSYSDAAVAARDSAEIEADCIYKLTPHRRIWKFNVKDKRSSRIDIPNAFGRGFWIYPTIKL